MKILLTGSTGFIGKNLAESLTKEYDVFALVRPQSNTNVLPKNVRLFNYREKDNSLLSFFKENKIEGIIHLASSVIVNHNNENIDTLINANIRYGTKILEFATEANVKWFINTGTFWQHYQNEYYNPVNLYAATKQAFEDIAKYYIETSNLKFVTLKLNDTFGLNDTRSKIFNLWDKISKTGKKLAMSPGKQIIDISYIDNVINAYKRLIDILNTDEIDINGKSFALKADKRYSLKELAIIYEKNTGRKLNIDWGARPYREREVMIPWNKGEEIPGYRPKYTVEESIKKYSMDSNE